MSDALFHVGEIEAQTRAGARDLVERVAPRMLRDHLNAQHQDFFAHLPFVVIGHRDRTGSLWADLAAGPPGFARAGDETHLELWSRDIERLGLQIGDDLGMLGLQPETRRRNRENGIVEVIEGGNLVMRVLQSYGNCPKHITPRRAQFDLKYALRAEPASVRTESFSNDMATLICKADTFFIASGHGSAALDSSQGVDVSHRGGAPGFVKVESRAGHLSIPDYSGNNLFNTVGNLSQDPRCGLLFVDFTSGALLQLTGNMTVEWDPASEVAPRALHFLPEEARWVHGVPLRWSAIP